jgi:hypothetical protein
VYLRSPKMAAGVAKATRGNPELTDKLVAEVREQYGRTVRYEAEHGAEARDRCRVPAAVTKTGHARWAEADVRMTLGLTRHHEVVTADGFPEVAKALAPYFRSRGMALQAAYVVRYGTAAAEELCIPIARIRRALLDAGVTVAFTEHERGLKDDLVTLLWQALETIPMETPAGGWRPDARLGELLDAVPPPGVDPMDAYFEEVGIGDGDDDLVEGTDGDVIDGDGHDRDGEGDGHDGDDGDAKRPAKEVVGSPGRSVRPAYGDASDAVAKDLLDLSGPVPPGAVTSGPGEAEAACTQAETADLAFGGGAGPRARPHPSGEVGDKNDAYGSSYISACPSPRRRRKKRKRPTRGKGPSRVLGETERAEVYAEWAEKAAAERERLRQRDAALAEVAAHGRLLEREERRARIRDRDAPDLRGAAGFWADYERAQALNENEEG